MYKLIVKACYEGSVTCFFVIIYDICHKVGGKMKLLFNESKLKNYIDQYEIHNVLPKKLLDEIQLVEYKADEMIIEEANPLHYYYFFVEGRLKIFQRQENGRNLLLQFYTKYATLGDVELLEQLDASCTVVALEHSFLLRIDIDLLRSYALKDIVFMRFIIHSLSNKLEITSRNYSNNLFYPVKNRLASYLLLHQVEGTTIELKESLQEISEFIGTTYRQLHRAFVNLTIEGIVSKENKEITVLEQQQLEQLAGQIYQIL